MIVLVNIQTHTCMYNSQHYLQLKNLQLRKEILYKKKKEKRKQNKKNYDLKDEDCKSKVSAKEHPHNF